MKKQIKQRIFIVGCPRSGNTLLQALLSAHSQIMSFPEIHFFQQSIGQLERRFFGNFPSSIKSWFKFYLENLCVALSIAKPRVPRQSIYKFLKKISREDMVIFLPKFNFFIKQNIDTFLKILDKLTLEQSKVIWMEKSPTNLNYIDIIEKFIPSAKFIHIIRNGVDVVASIHDAALKYPKPHWWGQIYHNSDRCITRWIVSIRISQKYSDKANHKIVKYEELVKNTRQVLKSLCDFIGIEYKDAMMQNYKASNQKLMMPEHKWLSSASRKIQNKNDTKFYQLFNEKERQHILDRVKENDPE